MKDRLAEVAEYSAFFSLLGVMSWYSWALLFLLIL